MARLNREYKGRGGPAEILTFPYAPERGPGAARGRGAAAARGPIGEIVLCWPAVLRGARERGVPARGYLLRLFAHGAAHLRGYRHDTDAAAARMEAAERRMLAPHVPARELGRLFS
jgi:probable rRNA maturation factor